MTTSTIKELTPLTQTTLHTMQGLTWIFGNSGTGKSTLANKSATKSNHATLATAKKSGPHRHINQLLKEFSYTCCGELQTDKIPQPDIISMIWGTIIIDDFHTIPVNLHRPMQALIESARNGEMNLIIFSDPIKPPPTALRPQAEDRLYFLTKPHRHIPDTHAAIKAILKTDSTPIPLPSAEITLLPSIPQIAKKISESPNATILCSSHALIAKLTTELETIAPRSASDPKYTAIHQFAAWLCIAINPNDKQAIGCITHIEPENLPDPDEGLTIPEILAKKTRTTIRENISQLTDNYEKITNIIQQKGTTSELLEKISNAIMSTHFKEKNPEADEEYWATNCNLLIHMNHLISSAPTKSIITTALSFITQRIQQLQTNPRLTHINDYTADESDTIIAIFDKHNKQNEMEEKAMTYKALSRHKKQITLITTGIHPIIGRINNFNTHATASRNQT